MVETTPAAATSLNETEIESQVPAESFPETDVS